MRTALFGMLVLVSLALGAGSAGAALSCTVQQASCPGVPGVPGVELFRLSAPANAHAELVSGTGNYPYRVCCTGVPDLGSRCSGTPGMDYAVVLRLSATTNAHVEQANLANYLERACLQVTQWAQQTDCTYTTDNCNAEQGYVCVATISAAWNAHVASCTAGYPLKVCCRANTVPPIITLVPPTPAEGATVTSSQVTVNANINKDVDSCIVQTRPLPPLTGQPFNLTMTVGINRRSCTLSFTMPNRNGPYEFKVFARDLASNWGVSAPRVINLQYDAPSSSITSPVDNGAYTPASWSAATPIRGSATDGQGIQEVRVRVQRAQDNQYWTGGWSWIPSPTWVLTGGYSPGGQIILWNIPLSVPAGEELGYTIMSRAEDVHGNLELQPYSTVVGVVDRILPQITRLTDLASTGNPNPSYSGEAVDPDPNLRRAVSKVQKVEYRVERQQGANWVVTTDWTEVPSYNATPPHSAIQFQFNPALNPGNNNVLVRATDRAGNVGAPVGDIVLYDGSIPYSIVDAPVFANSPYTAAEWAAGNPVRGRAFDDLGVFSVDVSIRRTSDSLYWNGQNWIPGEHWLSAQLTGFQQTEATWRWPAQASGIYIPDGDGQYHIRSLARDVSNQNEIPDAGQTVVYDAVPPVAWFTSPASQYTNNQSILVAWTGTDGVGIASFRVERALSAAGPWSLLLPPVTQPGQSFLSPVENGQTYYFRVNATDLAGNSNDPDSTIVNVTVDWTSPICTITPLPTFSSSPLTINWTAQETGSGVADLDAWLRFEGREWTHVNGGPWSCGGIGPSSNSTVCTNLEEGRYEIICGAADAAGNVGPNSTIEEVWIDNTLPSGGITEPDSPWTNSNPFLLRWTFQDTGGNVQSGMDFYTVQWRNDSQNPWTDIVTPAPGGTPTLPASMTSIMFGQNLTGELPAAEIYEGETFWLRALGVDQAGNPSLWHEVQTRIDTVPPNITAVNVTDQNGNPVNPSAILSVEEINFTSESVDQTSGLEIHTIWVQRTQEGVTQETYPCLSSPWPPLASHNCSTGLIPVGDADEVLIWSQAVDLAGNQRLSPAFALSPHPLANFVNHDIVLILGTKYTLEVQVRNLQPVPLSTVELTLSGYPLAGFVSGQGGFSDFEIGPDGREVEISNLQAGGRGTFQVEVLSSTVGQTQVLTLSAFGVDPTGTLTVSDQDEATVATVSPASFSALPEWAAMLLLGLAALGYAFVGRRSEQRKEKK